MTGSIKVLLIEDNPTDVLLMQAALESDRLNIFLITNAETLQQALACLASQSFDIILLDPGLTDSQGVSAVEILRRSAPALPILICSGNSDEYAALQAMQAGAQDYLIKGAASMQMAARAIRYALERERAQAALRQSEERYQQFISQSFEGISRTEFDQPIDARLPIEIQIDLIYENAYMAECNQALAEMYQMSSPQQMIGARLLDAHGGKDNPTNRAAFRRFIENGYKSINDETLEYDAQGKPVWFLSNTVGTVENGFLVRLWGTAINITERKQAEEALRQAERKYQIVADNNADWEFWFDPDQQFIYVSPACEQITGYSRDVFLGQGHFLETLIHPDDLADYQAHHQHTSHGIAASQLEFRLRHLDGGWRWIEHHCRPLFDEQGGFLGVRGSNRDITARKQAEEAHRTSEAIFTSAFENAPIGEALTSPDGRWLKVNRVLCSLLGYTTEELLECRFQDITHPDDLAADAEYMHLLLFKEAASCHFEKRYLHKSGAVVWVYLSVSLARDAAGEPLYFIVQVEDIGQRKREESFTQARLRLANLATQTSMESLLRAILDEVEALTDSQIGFFHFVAPDQNQIALQTWSTRTLESFCQADQQEKHYPVSAAGVWADSIRQGKTCIYNDYSTLERQGTLPAGHAQVTRLLSVPIQRHGQVVAVLGVGNKPQFYDESDRAMTERLADEAFDLVLHKRAEEALRKSEALLSEAQRIGRMGHWEWTAPGKELICSDEWFRILGLPQQGNRVSRAILDSVVDANQRQMLNERDRKAFAARADLDYEFNIRLADGRSRWIHQHAKVSYDEDGRPIRMMGIVQDISERKEAELANRRYSERLRSVVEIEHALAASLEQQAIYATLVGGLQQLFPAASAIFISSFDSEREIIKAVYAFNDGAVMDVTSLPELPLAPAGHGTQSRVIRSRQPLLIGKDLLKRFRPGAVVRVGSEDQDTQSAVYVPLLIQDQALGLLQLQSYAVDQFSEEDVRVLSLVANTAAGALQNARLYEMAQKEIAERKQAEIAVRLSEEKYRGLIKSLDSMIVALDANGRFLYLNDVAARQLGCAAEDILGRNLAEFYPESEAAKQLKDIQKVISEDRRIVSEFQSLAQGEWRWYHTTIQPVHDETGQPIYALINSTDIHDLKTAQQELLELNQTLEIRVQQRTAEVQDLYENAPTGYHSLDAAGNYLMINQTELNWLGYQREEMIGCALKDFISPSSSARFEQVFPLFRQSGQIKDLELDFVRKDGSLLPVLISATVVYDLNGAYVMSRSIVFDNTERKKAEEALRASEETYRSLFEASTDAIFWVGLDTRLMRVNPRGPELLGLHSTEELVGKSALEFIAPADQPGVIEHVDQLFLQMHLPPYECILIRKDSRQIQTEISMSLLLDSQRQPKMIQGVVRDITQRKQAEESLRRANLELERAMRMKDEFLASMSHELRTPLTGILGLSEALQFQTYGSLNEKQIKAIKNIESSGRHLLDLINDILDLSKIEAGKLELQIETCSLGDVCQASLQLIRGMAQKKSLNVSFSMRPVSIRMPADGRRLKQMLVNLLSNAVKFTPRGQSIRIRSGRNSKRGAAKRRAGSQDHGLGSWDWH